MVEAIHFDAAGVAIHNASDAAQHIEALINNTMWGDPTAYGKLCDAIHRLETAPEMLKTVAEQLALAVDGTSEIEFQWNEDGTVKGIEYAARTLWGETMERAAITVH